MTPEEKQINRIIDEKLESVNQELLDCRRVLAKSIAWNVSILGKYAAEQLLDELSVNPEWTGFKSPPKPPEPKT